MIKKENLYYLLIIITIFFLDRYSKIKIVNSFNDSSFYINQFLNFELTWNTGIGFGLLSSSNYIYYNSISVLITLVIFFLIYLSLKAGKYEKIIFSLIIGGAFGNLYDRLTFKAVPDFIDLHYDHFHWFTFNVADIFITLGIIAYIMKGSTSSN